MCASTSAGCRSELSSVAAWDGITSFPVCSDLVINFKTGLYKFFQACRECNLIGECLFELGMSSLLEEGDLGSFINTYHSSKGHKGGIIWGTILFLLQSTYLVVRSLVCVWILKGGAKGCYKFCPSGEGNSPYNLVYMGLEPFLNGSWEVEGSIGDFGIVSIGVCLSGWVRVKIRFSCIINDLYSARVLSNGIGEFSLGAQSCRAVAAGGGVAIPVGAGAGAARRWMILRCSLYYKYLLSQSTASSIAMSVYVPGFP